MAPSLRLCHACRVATGRPEVLSGSNVDDAIELMAVAVVDNDYFVYVFRKKGLDTTV